jgi:hypothetical protein
MFHVKHLGLVEACQGRVLRDAKCYLEGRLLPLNPRPQAWNIMA